MLLTIILLSYMLIQRKEKHQYAKLDIGYKQVAQKSAIWAHFKRNRFGLSRCNHCGLLCRQLGNSTNILFMHLNKVHPEYIYGSALKKKNQEQYMSDFIQTMTIEGYPIDRIIEGLHKLLTKHQHRFKQIIYGFLGDLPKARNQLVDYLPKLPIDTDRNAVDKIIFQKYPDLSIGTRKALAEEYFWIYSTDQEIILNFIQNGYKIISENDQDNVGIMILITETMRQAYFRYGDSLNIDVIDKVYKKRSPNGFAEYSCWFFTGQNENMENVLFGFAIMNESIKKNLKFLFIRFFNQMSNVLPISICIPPYIILEEQIRSVCKNTNIIINWYHKLKFMKQILEQQIEHQSIMKNICECFKTQSKMEFDFLMNKIMSKVSDQDAIRYGIQKNTQKYCIFNMTLKFMGFSIQANKYLTLESQVRKLFVYQRNLAQLFIFVIKLDKKLNKSIHTDKSSKNKNYFHTLKEFKLCKHIQERIKLNLDQMMIYKIQVIDPVTIRLATRKNESSKWKIFTLKFQIKQNYWICNCRFLYHTGIPCAHLIKILEKYGGDYRFYINSRWYKST